MQQQDWFSQNAPPAPVVAKGGDWFAANAPKAATSAPEPDVFEKTGNWIDAHLPGGEKTQEEKDQGVQSFGDFVAGNAKNIYEVSTPNLFHQLYNKATGESNTLEQIPTKSAEFLAYSMIGGEPKPEAAGARATIPEGAAKVGERPSRLAQAAENPLIRKAATRLATRVLRLVPGVGKVLDVADLAQEIHSNLTAPPKAAAAPALPQPTKAVLPAPRFDVIGANNTERSLLTIRGTRPPVTELPPTNRGLQLTAGEPAPGIAPAVSVRAKLAPTKVMRTTASGTRMVRNPDFPVRIKNGEVVKGKRFDLWEDKAIEDAAREDLAMHGRHAWKQVMDEFRANNDASVAKGQQVAQVKDWFSKNAPTTAGTVEGAAADTAFYQAARRELGEAASTSDVLKRAQEMKIEADTHAEDLTDLLRRSVQDALAKKKK
jgi:hypothetical protein